jgi:chemotaxis protein methyltransferase CheR
MSVRVTPEGIEAFRAVLARDAGLRFSDDKRSLLGHVLTARMTARSCGTVAAYLARLSPGGDELGELARALTVPETYFFRNPDQFRAFQALLAQRERAGIRHVRVLSAACASGEEPYSIAIAIRETLADSSSHAVSIVGTDLSPEAIERARAGVYPRWSLRATPEPRKRAWFRENAGSWKLAEEILRMVRFERDNLVHPAAGCLAREAYDFVFCRNVIMYFTPEAQRVVVAHLARSLVPGGHLFLGHAETLRGLSYDFRLCHSHDTFFYERRDATLAPPPPVERAAPLRSPAAAAPEASWFRDIGEATGRIERLAGTTESRDRPPAPEPRARGASPAPAVEPDAIARVVALMREECFDDALRALSNSGLSTSAPEVIVLRAILSTIAGETEAGEALCDDLLRADDLDASAHYVKALCREHAGDRDAAIEHSRAAAYLDATFAMPHLQLGRLARRAGDVATARRELEVALGLLAEEDATRIVLFGGGFAREALRDVCRGELSACGGDR